MIQTTVGDFKAHFSELLNSVIQGEDIEILLGREKETLEH